MPRGSKELKTARKEEIIDACAALYDTIGFNEISIGDIAGETSFTRTSIYNYFHTKEEIFLALLQRECRLWTADLNLILECEKLSVCGFAERMAAATEQRGCMLRIMATNLYNIEVNSRIENLTEFKKVYGLALTAIKNCLKKFFPKMTESDISNFIYAFFPFLFGVYPYTTVTEKQREAMLRVKVEIPVRSVYDITKSIVSMLLKPYGE